MAGEHILQSRACKEILLLKTQAFAGVMGIIGIKHARYGFRQLLFRRCADIIALPK